MTGVQTCALPICFPVTIYVNDEIKADETWKTHVEKKRLELAKKANQRRIDELKRRIEEKIDKVYETNKKEWHFLLNL